MQQDSYDTVMESNNRTRTMQTFHYRNANSLNRVNNSTSIDLRNSMRRHLSSMSDCVPRKWRLEVRFAHSADAHHDGRDEQQHILYENGHTGVVRVSRATGAGIHFGENPHCSSTQAERQQHQQAECEQTVCNGTKSAMACSCVAPLTGSEDRSEM